MRIGNFILLRNCLSYLSQDVCAPQLHLYKMARSGAVVWTPGEVVLHHLAGCASVVEFKQSRIAEAWSCELVNALLTASGGSYDA